ncbi:MAG: bifunctional riboflavin kinase/FAD synthetase [Flavisolibacter sp.]
MKVHRSLKDLPKFINSVLTIGTFDGVHEGHRKIIGALLEEATRAQGESIIITFNPHPRRILRPEENIALINLEEEKISLLEATSIDHLVIVPFTKEFASLSALQYIESFLIRHFKPHSIIIGYDHHFGKGRQGDFTLLEEEAEKYNFNLLEIPKQVLQEIDVSSTKIRSAITHGNLDIANKLLGYSFFFKGIVVKGDQLGRQLGYPTANLEYTSPDKIRTGQGVFAVIVQIGSIQKKGMLSIGTRPTLPSSGEKIEVNIFDWDQDIYGQVILVTIKKYLRPQKKYESLPDLVRQLAEDKRRSLDFLCD